MRKLAMLTLAAALTLIATAEAGTINAKTGLWQMDMTTESTGAPPIPPAMLNSMTPEQRARLQTAMQSQMNHPTQHSFQRCVTEKDLEEGFKLPKQNGAENCNTTVLSKSSTGEKARVDCSGQVTISSLVDWHVPTPTSMNGTVATTITSPQGTTMKSNGTIKGKWISTDCGSVH